MVVQCVATVYRCESAFHCSTAVSRCDAPSPITMDRYGTTLTS